MKNKELSGMPFIFISRVLVHERRICACSVYVLGARRAHERFFASAYY